MGRPPKEKVTLSPGEEPGRLAEDWQETSPKHEEGELALATEHAIIVLLRSNLEAKDMNAAIANAIRMLQVKHKLQGEPEERSFWGSSEDG